MQTFILIVTLLLFLAVAAFGAGAVPGSDWPSVRHDARLTGQSPLKGGFAKAPKEAWSIDLGGSMVTAESAKIEDVDGDGKAELLRALKDRIVCQTLSGRKLWELKDLAKPVVNDIRDFAGDGGRGIFITYTDGLETAHAMVDGRTGKSAKLFSTANNFGGTGRIGRILPGVKGLQYSYWYSDDTDVEGLGYLWSFENGLSKPTCRFKGHEKGVIYAPIHAYADIDGDGKTEMVMISHEQLWAYDIETGKRKFFTCWRPNGDLIRSYWSVIGLMPLKPGELPSILSINHFLPGVQVIKQDGKGGSSIAWSKLVYPIEYQYQLQVKIAAGAPGPFMDLDGDGQIEIIAAVTNEHKDSLVHLVIFGADRGDRLFDEAGVSILAVDDLDGDGKPEVILKRGDKISIANWTGKGFTDRWQSENAEPLLKPLEPEGDLRIMKNTTVGNVTLWRDQPGSPLFLMRIDGAAWACKLTPGGSLEKVKAVERHEALGNTSELDYKWDGSVLTTTVQGKEAVTYELPSQRTFPAPPPIAGYLDGGMRILTQNSEGWLLSVAPDGSDVRKLAAPIREATYRIADMDGDGRNEVLISVVDADGRPAVQIIDGKGTVLRTYHPAAPGGSIKLGPAGSLGPGKGQWFAVVVYDPAAIAAVAVYDGKTGLEMWRRLGYGDYDKEKATFALHVPTVVWDYNGDGADDLFCLSENFYGIIDVVSNKDLVDPMARTRLSDLIPSHWTAYAIPSLIDDPVSGKPRLVLSRSYRMSTFVIDIEGLPILHQGVKRDATPSNLAGIGDLDGDGKPEMVSARRDGLLTAFDWEPLEEKCSTCAKEEPLTKINRGGKLRWTFQLPPPVSDFASADLDGDGKFELLCGCGDGKLYALKESKGKCTVLWTVDLGRTVGSPIIADIDGDSRPEILVTSEDGRLHCLAALSDRAL